MKKSLEKIIQETIIIDNLVRNLIQDIRVDVDDRDVSLSACRVLFNITRYLNEALNILKEED